MTAAYFVDTDIAFVQLQRGNVKAIARIAKSAGRRGAYQIETQAYNVTGKAMGARQQQTAKDLRLEAKGVLTRDLYAAGWHSEQAECFGKQVVLWWPPVVRS